MEGANVNREMGNRRALKDIRNLVGAAPYPCAVTKKNVLVDKNQNFAAQRPVTRKFAASLANKSQPCHMEASDKHGLIGNVKHRKLGTISSLSSDLEKSTAIDVDVDLPMVEESEEMEECEHVEEVVMEDIIMESAVDIDSCDLGNPLAVVDYVDDIYNYYKRVEVTGCVSPDYMSNQLDINEKMRAILVDWLIEVHYKFELMDETLYLTINIIDRFLSRQSIIRKKLQLVGVTAMLLACKYEEVSVPVVDDLIQISDRAYTRQEVLDMEKLMANTLQFNMSVPTAYVFMRRFLKAAESDKKLELLSHFIIELCLVQYQMLKFQPSLLAAAAIYTAQCSLKGLKYWTKTCEQYTTYTEDQLLECSRMMVDFHQNAGLGKLTGVHRKYSTFKFGCAAKSEPALFLMDSRL